MKTTDSITPETLLRGSHNLDRMRKEVEELISMLIGLALRSNSGPTTEITITFTDEQIEWEITGKIYLTSPEDSCLEVKCWLLNKIGNTGSTRRTASYSTRSNSWGGCPRENIQKTHEGLPVFVKGMLETFSCLQEYLQPFLVAAEKQF